MIPLVIRSVQLFLGLGWVALAGILWSIDEGGCAAVPSGVVVGLLFLDFNGEFDPGSGRTLAACLTHASRAVRLLREYTSGERVSNT
jgi:hypothetical protein